MGWGGANQHWSSPPSSMAGRTRCGEPDYDSSSPSGRMMILLALSVLPAAASGLDGHWSVAPITVKIGYRRRTPIRSVSVRSPLSGFNFHQIGKCTGFNFQRGPVRGARAGG